MKTGWKSASLALYCAAWAGIVIGVSFIATIAKFDAPTLTRPVALDVGRHTFATLTRIEWALIAVLLLLVLYAGMNRTRVILLALLAVIIAGEALWLFPQLSVRADLVIANQPLPPSSLHAISVAAESAKVSLLALFAVLEIKNSRA